MAPRASKQADRKAGKKADKQEDDEPATAASSGDILARVKTLFMESCIAQTAPKLQALLKDEEVPKAKEAEKKEAEGKTDGEEKDNVENDAGLAKEGPEGATDIFDSLKARLTWCNVLGLSEPSSEEEAKKAWLDLKGLELDFGPRAKRRGSPGLERITLNVHNNCPQYLHVLLALMMLRAFLFRSWFACLPWLVGYQLLSLLLPLENLEKLPQVPLDQVPVKFRVAGSIAIHTLMWLFFLYEALWKTYFFEKIPLVGFFIYHAYAVRPQE